MKQAINTTILSALVTATSSLAYFVYDLNAQIAEMTGRHQAAITMLTVVQDSLRQYTDDSVKLMNERLSYIKEDLCK